MDKANTTSTSGWQSLRLPAAFFKANETFYIFDINHVNFLEVTKIIFDVASFIQQSPKDCHQLAAALPEYSVEDIRDALCEIEEIQRQSFLKPMSFQRNNRYSLDEIKKNLTTNLEGLYLNITSKCNLSCSYCIFGGKYENQPSLDQQEMSWDVAQKAIDFFFSNARQEGRLRVDFFGGEPLMAFPLMKRITESLEEKTAQRKQELLISISSNGTLLNDQIIDFLIKHNVLYQISIDGDKEIHDLNRKFKTSDIGTFDTILKNLQRIFDKNEEYFKKMVRLKAVITTESLDIGGISFFEIPLIKILKERRSCSILNKSPQYDLEKDQDFFLRIDKLAQSLLQKKDTSTVEELLEGLNYKKKNLFYLTLYNFFQVQVVNASFGLDQTIPFLKDCLIGIQGCVNIDGGISICYNSKTFIIGDVLKNTWYFDKIEEFHKKRYGIPDCKNCFIQRFCYLCYEKLNGNNDQFDASVKKYCEFNRHYYRTIFDYMLKIVGNNPNLWNEIQIIIETEQKLLNPNLNETPTSFKEGDNEFSNAESN